MRERRGEIGEEGRGERYIFNIVHHWHMEPVVGVTPTTSSYTIM